MPVVTTEEKFVYLTCMRPFDTQSLREYVLYLGITDYSLVNILNVMTSELFCNDVNHQKTYSDVSPTTHTQESLSYIVENLFVSLSFTYE